MKKLLISTAIIGVLLSPVFAQSSGPGGASAAFGGGRGGGFGVRIAPSTYSHRLYVQQQNCRVRKIPRAKCYWSLGN